MESEAGKRRNVERIKINRIRHKIKNYWKEKEGKKGRKRRGSYWKREGRIERKDRRS